MTDKTLFVLPTFNEAGNISQVLREIQEKFPNFEVLHIDDNSPDGTAEIAAELKLANYRQIRNFNKLGLGRAYLQGINWAVERNFKYLIAMDSDGSHLLRDLPQMILQTKSANLVIGSRWIPEGKIENWPWYRKLLSKLGSKYARWALGLKIGDLTSGYRIYDVDFLKNLDLANVSSFGYSFQIEMAYLIQQANGAIAEVPITFIERSRGKSKMTLGIAWEAFIWCTKARIAR